MCMGLQSHSWIQDERKPVGSRRQSNGVLRTICLPQPSLVKLKCLILERKVRVDFSVSVCGQVMQWGRKPQHTWASLIFLILINLKINT